MSKVLEGTQQKAQKGRVWVLLQKNNLTEDEFWRIKKSWNVGEWN